jgi:integrase/recombinase XerD
MSDLLSAYVADMRLRGQAAITVERKSVLTRSWLVWCRGHDIRPGQAGKDAFLAYLQECRAKGLRSTTLQKHFSNLAGLYAFLDEDGQAVRDIANIQKRYLKAYKPDCETRQCISVQDAARMVAATFSTRDKAILVLLLKTGIRRHELTDLDVSDVDLRKMTVRLKPTGKRSNLLVFIDDECAESLRRWLKIRPSGPDPALFLSTRKKRISGRAVLWNVIHSAERVGLHEKGGRLDERFGAHCCRHWFTTQLYRNGMGREYIMWLRGDSPLSAFDGYLHIDPEDVRRDYLAHIPQLGI